MTAGIATVIKLIANQRIRVINYLMMDRSALQGLPAECKQYISRFITGSLVLSEVKQFLWISR